MTNRELLQEALELMEVAIRSGDWKVDGACDPDMLFNSIRTRLAQPEPEPVAWKVWTVHNHIFFSIGVQTFQINDVLEHEPEVSVEEFSEWLATQLRHALTQLSNTAQPKKEWVELTDEEIKEVFYAAEDGYLFLSKAIEAKLKEKNT